ncbi:MAG: L-threonylcarbamoyladenylate synthase [Saprospiraceae bacterium]|nr:L-threonylcarbamoyladenylate synthase [Saprospiraceae bacterium]MDZ4702987.1 L-threonylcarbamoyladenylate synthase [Saprospiraceae bacterium]
MLLNINPINPEGRKISQVVEILRKGGIIIYPTDTVYALGCDIFQHKAVERICQLRRLDPAKAMLSCICKDISQIAIYTKPINTPTFKLLRNNLPGPFTFILEANNDLPKLLKNRKNTIGVRIPDHRVPLDLVEELGRPILTTSLKSDDDIIEYYTDPSEIYEIYKKLVDVVIDSGPGGILPSALINSTGNDPEVVRDGPQELRW